MKANVNLPEGMGSPNTQAEALRNDDKEVAAQQSKPWIHTLTLFPGMTIPEIERAINEWMVPHPIAQCHRFIDDIKQAISLIESCAGPS